MSRLPKSTSKIPRQSDIVIGPDGQVNISFFWDDLTENGHRHQKPEVSRPTETFDSVDVGSAQNEYRFCQLCPRKCGFDRVAKAHLRCGDWQLRVSTAGLSLGDEPIVAGERGSGVVMLGGCPLKCPSCHNPEMVAGGVPFSALDLYSLAWDLAEDGAHNLQLLSPTVHIPFLIPILQALKKTRYPLPIVFKSSGYENIEQLKRFEGLVDVYLPDLKFGPCSSWANQAGVRNYFDSTLEAIGEMLRQQPIFSLGSDTTVQKGVLVRHVRSPLPSDEANRIESALKDLERKGAQVSLLDNFVPLD